MNPLADFDFCLTNTIQSYLIGIFLFLLTVCCWNNDGTFLLFQRTSYYKYHVEKLADPGRICFHILPFFFLILGKFNWHYYLNAKFQALYQVTVLLVLNFRGRSLLNLESDNKEHANKVKNTLIFNSFVLCQVSFYSSSKKVDKNLSFRKKIISRLLSVLIFHMVSIWCGKVKLKNTQVLNWWRLN